MAVETAPRIWDGAGKLLASARERPPQAADVRGHHPPAFVKAQRILVAGAEGQPDETDARGGKTPLDLLHEQRADPPAAQLGLDRERLELTHALVGLEAQVAVAIRKKAKPTGEPS